MNKTWLKVSEEYERLMLIEEGHIKALLFDMAPGSFEDYSKEQENEDSKKEALSFVASE